MESVESYLQIAIEKYNSLSNDQIFSLFYLNHSFIIANIVYSQLTAPGGRRGTPLLFGLLLCIVTGLGGSILCNFLLGKPQILLDNDIFIGYMLIAWVFTVYLPPMRWLVNFPLVSLVCYVAEGFFVSQFVTGGVNLGVATYKGSMVAPILLGTLSGCGGMLLSPYLLNTYKQKIPFETELTNPSIGSIAAFLLATFYYVATYVRPFKAEVFAITPKIEFTLSAKTIVGIGFALEFFYFWFLNTLSFFQSLKSTEEEKKTPRKGKKEKKED